MQKINWDDENFKNKFIEMYTKVDLGIYVYTYEDIMKEIGVLDRSTIRNGVKRYNLEKRNVKLYNKKSGLTYNDRKYIIANYNNKTVKELASYVKNHERTIVEFLKSQNLNIIRDNPRSKYEIMMNNKNFIKDYNDLLLSDAYVARKYKMDHKTISRWRSNDFGEYRKRINTFLRKTTPECIFEEIMHELELPFFYQWKICNWNVDYYFGKKICVEINGDYWHQNTDYVIEKDKRKKDDLIKKGYTLIEFSESDLNNKEYIKNIMLKYIASLDRNI